MSGQVRGKIECAISAINRQDSAQVYFKNIYDFFSSHPNYTLIALQYGLTGSNLPNSTTSGTGTNYYDQALSFGYNAFFVTRANATAARPFDIYYLFQWGGSNNQTGANTIIGATIGPGNPALAAGTQIPFDGNHNCAFVQAAIGIGGTGGSTLSPNNGNPWKGTQNGNGLDTKSTLNVWGAPPGGGTGAMVFPRSNNGNSPSNQQVGTHQSIRQNGSIIFSSNSDTNPVRQNIVGDDDSWCLFVDFSDNGNYFFIYNGLFVPRPNTGQNIPYPFCSIASYNNIPIPFTDQSIYGAVAGNDTQSGGIAMPSTGSVGQLQIDVPVNNWLSDANYNPDRQIAGTAYDEWPVWVGPFEPWPNPLSGYLGQIHFMKLMYNVPTNDTKTDFSRIFIGSTTLAAQKWSVPWDAQNNTVPRSGASRSGVTFVANLGGGI